MSFNYLFKSLNQKKITKKKYISKCYNFHKTLINYQSFLKNSEVNQIQITNQNIIFDIKKINNGKQSKKESIKLIADTNDERSIPIETFNFKKFEPNDSQFLIKFAKVSKNIIDVGANLGWYSLNFNFLKNTKSIHSFEPIPRTYSFFRENIKINKAKKIIANNFALSDKSGKQTFYLSNETGSASMKNIQNKKKVKKIVCKLTTLDRYLVKNKIKCDLIKVDTEGSELFVFKGAIHTLKKQKPIVFTEMLRKWSAKFNYHPNDIIQIFHELNYSCFKVTNNKLIKIDQITKSTLHTNFFFLHNDKHKKFIKRPYL